MSVKKPYVMLLALLSALMLSVPAGAANTTAPVQAYVWEQNLDVFLSGSLETENLSCMIANQEAEITGSGALADMGVTIRTVLLVDVSTSIPEEARAAVLSLINTLIETIRQTEQYQIATFGEQLKVLQDFTSDRYDLARAAEAIQFADQMSTIYDAVYNTIPETQPIDGGPCYYRTVIITDGVDEADTGVTVQELYLKLQSSTYPIDVVAVSRSAPAGQNQELGALTRISGGQYYTLAADSDTTALAGALDRNEMYWVRAAVPGSLLDGVVRQVDITDGAHTVQFDSKFPVYSGPAAESAPPKESAGAEATQDPAQAQSGTESPEAEPTGGAPDEAEAVGSALNIPILLLIVATVAVAVIVLVIVIIAVNAGKKGKEKPVQGQKLNPMPAPNQSRAVAPPKIPPTAPATDASQPTFVLQGEGGGEICIRLHNAQMPNETWEFTLQQDVLVGRSLDCQLRLSEASVSRVQCKIFKRGDVMVENISHANVTKLNNQILTAPAVLRRGDMLTCGRVSLAVDYVQIGAGPQIPGNFNR